MIRGVAICCNFILVSHPLVTKNHQSQMLHEKHSEVDRLWLIPLMDLKGVVKPFKAQNSASSSHPNLAAFLDLDNVLIELIDNFQFKLIRR